MDQVDEFRDRQTLRVDVFFYGLFMDETLLREKGIDPQNRRLAFVENFSLVIGDRASLVPSEGSTVFGVVFSLTQSEVDDLYSEGSVKAYRPETVRAKLLDGSVMPVLCFNLPTPPTTDKRNVEYVAKLKDLASRLGLPPNYVSSIQ